MLINTRKHKNKVIKSLLKTNCNKMRVSLGSCAQTLTCRSLGVGRKHECISMTIRTLF